MITPNLLDVAMEDEDVHTRYTRAEARALRAVHSLHTHIDEIYARIHDKQSAELAISELNAFTTKLNAL